jgi:hypothetical protein
LRTIAGAVIASSSRCTRGRTRCGVRRRRGRAVVLCARESEEMRPLRIVELERTRERLEHGL